MRQLIAALGADIKASGKNWVARCPVHGDKDFAMSIKSSDVGGVMAHCHACGANGLDLYRALGLNLDELFGKKLERGGAWMPQNIADTLHSDRLCLDFYREDLAAGKTPSLVDKRRAKLAEARIKGIEEKFNCL